MKFFEKELLRLQDARFYETEKIIREAMDGVVAGVLIASCVKFEDLTIGLDMRFLNFDYTEMILIDFDDKVLKNSGLMPIFTEGMEMPQITLYDLRSYENGV